MINKLLSKKNKALLLELVRTDFKLRYQGSAIGYAWSLLRPLFMFVILYAVFAGVFKLGSEIPNYPIYLFIGIVLWSFFTEMTSQSLGAIVGRGDLIRKIRIPRWMIIVSTSISALINLSLNMIIVLIIAAISGMNFLSSSILFPLFIVEIYIFSLGLSLILSALFVKYRDISFIWEVLLQAGFYATPILYPLTLIANATIQKILLINPMAQSIQGARNVFVTHETLTIGEVYSSSLALLIPLAITVITLLIGILYFRKEAPDFAENL
ncbi:ABC transporter permease [Candidatus Saccharibacteria bacterium]|nr:ABC transporter permease [Candidatus Saccharibacteria bacterium]